MYRADETDWAGELDQFTDTTALRTEYKALSFCLWQSPEHARDASHLPLHNKAVRFAFEEGRDVYQSYDVEKYLLSNVGAETVEATMEDSTFEQKIGGTGLRFSRRQIDGLFVPAGIAA